MSHLQLLHANVHFIREAYQDFILSRQAALLSPKTIEFYEYTVGGFVAWLESQSIPNPSGISPQHPRAFLAEVGNRGVKDSTVHAYGRGVRAFLGFLKEEGYISRPIRVRMPKVAKQRLPLLSVNQLQKVLRACRSIRDKALVLLMADTGIRRAEVVNLKWGHINLSTGLVRIEEGKGKKDRAVVVGVATRLALLKYRRSVPHDFRDSVFGLRASGVRMALKRLGQRASIHLTAHMLRRSFATLSLLAGQNLFVLQALMGHSDIGTTRKYVELVDGDLIKAHEEHGPVDRFLR